MCTVLFPSKLGECQTWTAVVALKPAYVKHRVKRVLVTFGVARGEQCIFKSIRAERATEMAKEGHSIGEILGAGE